MFNSIKDKSPRNNTKKETTFIKIQSFFQHLEESNRGSAYVPVNTAAVDIRPPVC